MLKENCENWQLFLLLFPTNDIDKFFKDIGHRGRLKFSHKVVSSFSGHGKVGVNRYGSEERNVRHLCKLLSSTFRKDVGAVTAVRADETAHVLNDAQNFEVRFPAKRQFTANIANGNSLKYITS